MSDHETMATELEASGNYKILRKITPGSCIQPYDGEPTIRGVILDVETTGLFPNAGGSDGLGPKSLPDEIIEIALVPFDFTSDFRVVRMPPSYQSLRQPSMTIPAEIEKLTGISDELVKGHVLDLEHIAEILEPADIVLAHNAAFDRVFAEKLLPILERKKWACSLTEIPWKSFGYEGRSLGQLLAANGFFSIHHRALDDCRALLGLLACPLGDTGISALGHLIQTSAAPTIRIWAQGAPYDRKDFLKARSYRWNSGEDRRPRAWYRDVAESEVEAETAFLRETIFGKNWSPQTMHITALDRFSGRV